jgi:hypothetical protein
MSTFYPFPRGPIDAVASPRDLSANVADAPSLGVFQTESTQRFIYGTRYLTWDGRVYKYSLSGAICYTHRLNAFWNTISSDVNGIDYSALTNAQSAGDREITLTNGSTALAEDYLAGGIVIIVPTETTTDREVMTRVVIGNDAAVASAECRMFLERPLETALTTSNNAYVMPSNYNNIRYSASVNGTRSFAGLAATAVTAASLNFWCQTYGPCNMAYQSARVGKTAYYRRVFGRHDGSGDIETQTLQGGGTVVSDQVVGFGMDNNGDANGTTNLMLTISY